MLRICLVYVAIQAIHSMWSRRKSVSNLATYYTLHTMHSVRKESYVYGVLSTHITQHSMHNTLNDLTHAVAVFKRTFLYTE